MISVDGKGEALVVDEAARPDWSPDGSLIAFGSIRNGPSRIYTIRPDGTGLNVLSSGPDDGFPAWSPDGTRIAFHSARSRKRDLLPEVREEDPSLRDVPLPSIYAKDVYVMDAEGTGETALTHGLSDNEDPAWSPNGTEIVFQSDRENNQYRLFVMDANGARVRRILDRWAGSVDWSAGR